jgi:putative ABC transport system substrate-binding protein
VAIEYRWAEGSDERATEIASEFIRLKVDVIVTSGGVLLGAKRVTTAIPIVFAIANDPVGSGFVASLARPGGNITGLSLQSTDIATKRLELLREILPGIRRLAILVNGGNPGAALELGEVGTATRAFGLEVSTVEIRRAEDIVPAFEVLKGHADALYVGPDALIVAKFWFTRSPLAATSTRPSRAWQARRPMLCLSVQAHSSTPGVSSLPY